MSVVAHAGAWFVSVAIIPQLVATIESTPLAASRRPSGENAPGVAVIATPSARSVYARSPATPPMAWLPTIR